MEPQCGLRFRELQIFAEANGMAGRPGTADLDGAAER